MRPQWIIAGLAALAVALAVPPASAQGASVFDGNPATSERVGSDSADATATDHDIGCVVAARDLLDEQAVEVLRIETVAVQVDSETVTRRRRLQG